MQRWLEAVEKIPLLWRKTVWGEEVVAALGSVPIIDNPRFPTSTRLTFELVRIKNRLFVRYTTHTVEKQVGYIALRDMDELQAIFQEAVRQAGEQGKVAVPEEASTPAVPTHPPREKSRLTKLGEYATLCVLVEVGVALWGIALVWFFGVQSLVIYLLCLLLGLVVGVIRGAVSYIRATLASPEERSGGWMRRVGLGALTLLFALFGALVGITIAGVAWVPASLLAGSLLKSLTLIEVGIGVGLMTVLPGQGAKLLRDHERAEAAQQALGMVDWGASAGILTATAVGLLGVSPEETLVWAIVGALFGLDILSGPFRGLTPPPAEKNPR